jgi:hypothetical protein
MDSSFFEIEFLSLTARKRAKEIWLVIGEPEFAGSCPGNVMEEGRSSRILFIFGVSLFQLSNQ